MSLQELKAKVESLPRDDFWMLYDWIAEHANQRWDQEIEEDSRAGKLDHLVEQALEERRQGRCRPLP